MSRDCTSLNGMALSCHPERSEGSVSLDVEMLRFAQHDRVGSLVTLSRSEGSVSLGLELRIEADKSAVGTVNRPLRPLCSAFATRSRLVDCQQTIHTPAMSYLQVNNPGVRYN